MGVRLFLVFIEADLDEVVSGAERSHVIHALIVIQLGMHMESLGLRNSIASHYARIRAALGEELRR
jgi:hypothetical protein